MVIRYCRSCDAKLDKQHGFSRLLPYWFCRGCGELLINPDIDMHDRLYPDVLWFCDKCGELLNTQTGFEDDKYLWVCERCDYVNEIFSRGITH